MGTSWLRNGLMYCAADSRSIAVDVIKGRRRSLCSRVRVDGKYLLGLSGKRFISLRFFIKL